MRPRGPTPVRSGREDREPTIGAKHTVYLIESGLLIEPVKRVPDGYRVHRAVGERDRLSDSLSHPLLTDAGGEYLAQRRQRLDSDHIETMAQQRTGELASPGGQVEDRCARRDTQLGRDGPHDSGHVLGAAALILAGDLGEALG
jgi:hypothetical protein